MKFSSVVLLLASTPPLAVALCALLLGLGVPPVGAWFWPAPGTNVAEAAALGDAARVRALAARGVRLDDRLPVRAEFRENDAPAAMSPLEAATWRRSDSLVQVLLDLGVRPSAEELRRLHCLATASEASQVATLLQEEFQVVPGQCAGVVIVAP